MFVRWESLMDILTQHSIVNNFMETFKNTVNDEKIKLCMKNNLIRYIFHCNRILMTCSRFLCYWYCINCCFRECLEQWLDSAEFNDSLKSSVKSQKTRLEANGEFKKDRLKVCCKLYTKAAQFAPHKSLESALAFSNRSAIYMRLDKYQVLIPNVFYFETYF